MLLTQSQGAAHAPPLRTLFDPRRRAGFEDHIHSIASETSAFGKPVLLFNGDSHHYRSDNPLKSGQPCVFESGTSTDTVACNTMPAAADFTPDAWANHPNYNVSNFRRVVVHGSTEPFE